MPPKGEMSRIWKEVKFLTTDELTSPWPWPDLGYVKEDGQTSDGQHVTEQEAAVTRPGIAIIVMMSQTHSLKGGEDGLCFPDKKEKY